MVQRLMLAVAVGGGVVAATGAASVLLGRELLACYWDAMQMPLQPICGSGLWGREWVPFLLLAICVAVAVTCVGGGAATLYRQFRGAVVFRQALGVPRADLPIRLSESAARVGTSTRLQFVDSPAVVGVTVGVLRRRIVVTSGLVDRLDDDELDAVVAHEDAHATGRHPLAFGVARTAVAASLWLPGLRQVADRIVLNAEIAADAAAAQRCGLRPLASALCKLIDAPGNADPHVAVGAIDGLLAHRVRALAGEDPELERGPQRGSMWIAAGLALGPVLVATGLLRAKGIL